MQVKRDHVDLFGFFSSFEKTRSRLNRPVLRRVKEGVAAQLLDPAFGHESGGPRLGPALGGPVLQRLIASNCRCSVRHVDDPASTFPDPHPPGPITRAPT